MSKYSTDKVVNLVDAGAIFASAIETDKIKLDNYQTVKFVITSGEGDGVTTQAKIVAVLPDTTEVDIKETEITIGDNTVTEIDVVANEIAHHDADEIKLKITAVASSEIEGNIVAVLESPRYSE